MPEPKAHQIYKQVPLTLLTYGNPPSTPSTATNGWEIIDVGGIGSAFAHRTYIDLSSWASQQLTTFTQGIDIQKGLIPLKGTTVPASQFQGVYEFDFITTRRLTDAELGNLFGLPGFLPSTVDLMEVIYGERMIYAENATVPGTFVQISGETFGSGNPTAMSRMHWTRLVFFHQPAEGDVCAIYPTNLVVQAMTVEEKDLVWMERLRRSYKQQSEII